MCPADTLCALSMARSVSAWSVADMIRTSRQGLAVVPVTDLTACVSLLPVLRARRVLETRQDSKPAIPL